MTEGIGGVEHAGRTPESLRVERAGEQVAHQGLARRNQLVGEHVPGADLEPPRLHERAEVRFALGARAQVVLDQHRLAIEKKAAVRRVSLEALDELVHDWDEAGLERGSREIPLSIPMRVGDEVKDETAQAESLGRAYLRDSIVAALRPAKVNYHNQPGRPCHAKHCSCSRSLSRSP